MPAVRTASVAALCLLLSGCGSSEPRSPLILGKEGANALPGPRTLTASQQRALKDVITSSGAVCDAIDRTLLRDVDATGQAETWDVRCAEGPYTVNLFADGTAAQVQRCFGWIADGCSDGYSRRRFGQNPSRRAPAGELNPDLGKLLEPMTAKDGKAD